MFSRSHIRPAILHYGTAHADSKIPIGFSLFLLPGGANLIAACAIFNSHCMTKSTSPLKTFVDRGKTNSHYNEVDKKVLQSNADHFGHKLYASMVYVYRHGQQENIFIIINKVRANQSLFMYSTL